MHIRAAAGSFAGRVNTHLPVRGSNHAHHLTLALYLPATDARALWNVLASHYQPDITTPPGKPAGRRGLIS
jgi:hypothetical protein